LMPTLVLLTPPVSGLKELMVLAPLAFT
jgi:hypothetical protein